MTDKEANQLYAMRHSLAHIMALAIKQIWPDTKFGVGPVIENGFFYDVDTGSKQITDDDLPAIEANMRKIIKEDIPFERFSLPIDEAIQWAKKNRQPYKLSLLEDLKKKGTTAIKGIDSEQLGVDVESQVKEVSFYKLGDFVDLCRGPHVESSGKVGAFKLDKLAGAYWRGDENNKQLQRVYGYGFLSREDLDRHLAFVKEAKERDHRRLGKMLDLYTTSSLVGSGLPLFTPRGTWLRELLGRLSQELREKRGFERIWSPHITKNDLYKTSGHWEKFGDELFLVKSQETSDDLVLKPMNCPHHTQIYASKQRSYRDMPIRYMENTTDYRDEKSGELHGLSRVRALTQDDSHVFCRRDQIEQEVTNLVQAARELYQIIDMQLSFRLSFRDDSDGYLGDDELWKQAQNNIEQIAKNNKLEYHIEEGEAAFYGPKIDFLAHDAIGRTWQVATVQLDFVQPVRFGLSYINQDGKEINPVMIHCALLGSIERFLSVYIEHTKGEFPFWLAPEQIRILTINDTTETYVAEVRRVLDAVVLMEPLKFNELRYTVDERNQSIGRKIRDAEVYKIPAIMIIGPKDKDAATVSVRVRGTEDKVALGDLDSWIRERR